MCVQSRLWFSERFRKWFRQQGRGTEESRHHDASDDSYAYRAMLNWFLSCLPSIANCTNNPEAFRNRE